MATERKNPRDPKGPRAFDDMLKKPCPYHQGPVKHALEDCSMLRHYRDDAAKQKSVGDRDDDKDNGFPKVRNAFMIFGGPSACLTVRQRKRGPSACLMVRSARGNTIELGRAW